jgi:biopolymer transport protein ExbB
MQDSSLYRVYAAGCEELKLLLERKGSSLQELRGLSERIINGFKAALEKESMYESRKFSAGMFIINMSVAGGPFLGLLGTVWGVMNTFASLAEAGEANLTAIAPGVASALACTLAGLLVAIPALFASIYITGRVRDMNADMNVFIDEFILKMENERGDAL